MQDAVKMKLDVNSLTINEVVDLEDALGTSMDTAFRDGEPKGKALRAILWIIGRRDNPDFTLEEAGELQLGEVDLEAEDVDPTEAAG